MELLSLEDIIAMDMFNKSYSELSEDEIMLHAEYYDDLRNPEWQPIILDDNYTDYIVSNIGTVKHAINKTELSTYNDRKGYEYCHLRIQNADKHCAIHRLVALAFIPNPNNKPEVNHINTNTSFNWYKNLEWVTRKENVQWSIQLGHQITGVKHHNSKFTEEQIRSACKMLENPNVVINDVVKKTGVSLKTINHIRFDNGWHNIAKDYNIRVLKRNSGPRFSDISIKIADMISDGKSNKEIYAVLDLTGASAGMSRKSISDRIYHIRHMISKQE